MYSIALLNPILLAMSAGTLAKAAPQSSPQSSNMMITVSDGLNCNQDSGNNYTVPLPYNTQITNFNNDSMQIQSYSLSRATTLQEQLDFSGPTRGMGAVDGLPEQCTLFHETTSPDSNGNSLAANLCYGLLLGPAECLRFFLRN